MNSIILLPLIVLFIKPINGYNINKYDKLRELTNFGNYQALDFLNKFSEN